MPATAMVVAVYHFAASIHGRIHPRLVSSPTPRPLDYVANIMTEHRT